MPTADLNGTTIWYETMGDVDAPALLALHGGLGFDHLYMERSFGRLADRFRVVLPDHRCNGKSLGAPVETMTMEQLADDAAALLDHIAATPAIVLGHSYGGFVAQELALRHPDAIVALVLIDTTPGQLGTGETADETTQGPPLPPEAIELLSVVPQSDEEFEANGPRILPFYLHGDDTAALEALVAGTVFKADAMVRSMQVLAGWSSVDRLATIRVPTLVIAGRHDVFTSWPQSQRIASRIPGAELVVFEHSGHFPWVEEPALFNATLDGWLERLEARA